MMSSNPNFYLQDDPQDNPEMNEPEPILKTPELEATEFKAPSSDTHSPSHSHPHRYKEPRKDIATALDELTKITDPEAKIQYAIHYMETSLAQSGIPNFKHFWEMRKLCLEFFKENIPASIRSTLWNKYSDLSKEARRLKDILDEQSAFAVEQIEIAIEALEAELQAFDVQVEKISSIGFSFPSPELNRRFEKYDLLQRQLNLLNTYAARINVLRKELIKTDMRIKSKNQFFQRLSKTGDSVFPKRKELIKEVSNLFIADVEEFIKLYCDENIRESLFILREDIKTLQGIAKTLTLNTHAFTHTRTILSSCWDKLKVVEKGRKKIRAQQKVTYKEVIDKFTVQFKEFKQQFEAGELNLNVANQKLEEMSNELRNIQLGREEARFLRGELAQLKKLVQEHQKSEEQQRQELENEKTKQKQDKVDQIKDSIEKLLQNEDNYNLEQATKEREEIVQAISGLSLSKLEKQAFERQLKPLKDLITEKNEKVLLNLSEDDKQTLSQLKEILKQRKERRAEIKEQIEIYRKVHGNSGFDITQAILYSDQMNEEKERLEKANQGIKDIEEKIKDLQKKVKQC